MSSNQQFASQNLRPGAQRLATSLAAMGGAGCTADVTQISPAPSAIERGDVDSFRILRLREVMRLTGMGRSSIYAAIGRGQFPRQVQLSRRCVGWRAREIDAWLRSRVSAH